MKLAAIYKRIKRGINFLCTPPDRPPSRERMWCNLCPVSTFNFNLKSSLSLVFFNFRNIHQYHFLICMVLKTRADI